MQSHGRRVFQQLKADDFEWKGKNIRLKPHVRIGSKAIVFVNLRGNAEEKKKLKAAFGFVTPGGERFEGLLRSSSKDQPLVQILLGSRETNQGLTFLRLQHIHILEPNPRGWGQIIQTMGRGIRRGTHEGITDEHLRKVRTTIYATTLDDGRLKEERERQRTELVRELTSVRSMYQSQYCQLKRLLGADGVKEKEVRSVRKALKPLAKNFRILSADKAKLENEWLRVFTGKVMQGGSSQPKTAMVRMWKLLPDEAVFRATRKEEADRAKYDKVIRESSVDFELLLAFHKTRSESAVRKQDNYARDLEIRYEQARHQMFESGFDVNARAGLEFVGEILRQIKTCDVCGDASVSKKTKIKYGVKCCEEHFVCSECYHICLAAKRQSLCSSKDAHEHFKQRRSRLSGVMECNDSNCFAVFCGTGIKFPVYWKKQDTQHCDFTENPFMIPKLQSLIRESVRDGCGTGCKGRDGDGRGTKSATVTRVLRIENGPLWETFWKRKQEMIKDHDRRKQSKESCKKLRAETMKGFDNIFRRVQVNQDINEMFLFHGTKFEKDARSIGKGGFDPAQANISGMYGGGAYCADYSCKSMQYTTDDQNHQRVFIICRVLMGRAYPTKTHRSGTKEPPQGFDSVYAQDGVIHLGPGWSQHNEFVTYDPDQGDPTIVHYLSWNHSDLTLSVCLPPTALFLLPVYPEYIVWIKLA